MSLFKPLRDQSFRYRKRKQISLDGTVSGLELGRMRGGYHFPGEIRQETIGPTVYHQYPSPPPREYEPHPGFADFPESEYDTYHANISPAPIDCPRHAAPSARPLHKPPPPPYRASLMTNELFTEAMQEVISKRDSEPSEPVPFDNPVMAIELMHAPAFLEHMVDRAFYDDPVQEIEAAMTQQFQEMEQQMAPEPVPEPMPDPYMEQQQMYDEQMRQMMDPFGMMGPMGPGFGPGPMM